jgi:hypothetical protein
MAIPGMPMMDEEERRRQEAMGLLPPEDAVGGGGPPPVAAPAPVAAPSPAPAPMGLVMQPTEQDKTVVTAKRASPESQRAMREGEAAGVALLDATRREQDAKAAQAKVDNQAGYDTAAREAEHAKGRETFQKQHLEWLKKVDEYAERDVKGATQRVEQDYQASQKNYWADKPWYAKVLAAVAVAASRRNMRIMGENPNASGVQAAIDSAVEEDKKAKEAKLLKSKEYLTLAKTRPADARALHEKRLKEFDAEQAAELTLVNKEAAKLKASKALDPALIDAQADVINATAQEKYAKSKLDNRQHYESTIARTDVDTVTPQAGAVDPATMRKFEALRTAAGNADRELQALQGIVKANGNKVPTPGTQQWEAYRGTARRAAKSIALVESGSPDAEASDKTIDSIVDRISRGGAEAVAVDLGARFGIGEGTGPRETAKLATERDALKARQEEFARARGAAPAPAHAAASKPYPDYSMAELQQAFEAAKKAKNTKAITNLTKAINTRRKMGE